MNDTPTSKEPTRGVGEDLSAARDLSLADRRSDLATPGNDGEHGKPEPNPEWEALADAAHDAIVAEVGEPNPFDTLAMLERWKRDAEPVNEQGQISFSRAMLDSAEDALRVALNMARSEYLTGKAAYRRGLQDMREMLARFVEQGGDTNTAASLRANWNPEWGDDPGRPARNLYPADKNCWDPRTWAARTEGGSASPQTSGPASDRNPS